MRDRPGKRQGQQGESHSHRWPPITRLQRSGYSHRLWLSWSAIGPCFKQGFSVPGAGCRRRGLLEDNRGGPISTETRVNERIRVPEVRLIGPGGEQVGIVRIEDALRVAAEPISTLSK